MAREHPRYANMEFPDYEYREYPKMIYPGAPDPRKPYDKNGKPLKGILVQDEDEERRVLQKDANLLPTISPGVQRVQTPADEKTELLERAKVMGVQVDARWSVARIQDAIDSHGKEEEVV